MDKQTPFNFDTYDLKEELDRLRESMAQEKGPVK